MECHGDPPHVWQRSGSERDRRVRPSARRQPLCARQWKAPPCHGAAAVECRRSGSDDGLRPVGARLKAIRSHRGWTQEQLSARSGVSASAVSLVEHGRADRLTLATVNRVAEALGARLSVRVYWNGEALDRLRDQRHADIVEQVIRMLKERAWAIQTEASFSEYGERGSIDVLAFHSANSALLVIEAKSVVPDLQAMLSNIDRKARLAPGIAAKLGWSASSVSRVLILPDARTARRRIHQHEATFTAALPARSRAVRQWLRQPEGAIRGILFLPNSNQDAPRHRSRRS